MILAIATSSISITKRQDILPYHMNVLANVGSKNSPWNWKKGFVLFLCIIIIFKGYRGGGIKRVIHALTLPDRKRQGEGATQ